jgi:imidazole glycerol-phosphate synthase subunit HisF
VKIRPRVIPVLQISDGYLVKTTKFAKPRYVGDPINALKIFNDKQVDEVIVCDIDATRRSSVPDFRFLESIASEAFMPVGYGGGVRTASDAKRILELGMEKVIINSALQTDSAAVSEIASTVGTQSVVASIDAKRSFLGKYSAYIQNARTPLGIDAATFAREAVALGAGEIIVTSIDREGTGSGYDTELIRQVAMAVSVPVVALGGASTDSDFAQALEAGASAVAAGSRFVFYGKHRAVLITYLTPSAIQSFMNPNKTAGF